MSQSPLVSRKESDEELFRLLIENVKDYAIFVLDPQGRVQSWNPGAERMLGYNDDEIIGQPVAIFFTPEDVQAGVPQQELRDALVAGRGNDDRWHVRKDGSRLWAGGSMTPLWDDKRELRGYAKIMRDRTEWKRAQEEQASRTRETERRRRLYEAALSNTPDFVFVFDLDHRFAYANEGLLKIWGRTWDEAIGKNCLELGYEPWHAAMHNREIDQVIATKQPVKGEVPFTGKFGRRIYEYIFVPVIAENGEVEAVAGTTRDVTDRRQAEEASRETERRWRNLAEALPNLVWTDLPNGQCDYLSSQWRTYTGIPEEELLGFNWLERVIHPDDRERTLACWLTAVADKGVYDLEYRIRRHDGEYRWFKTRGVPIRDETGQIVKWFGTCTDMEDQKRAVETLSEADRRKDEFLATLAHELRNPLAPIRNSLEILKMPRVDAVMVQQTRDMMERQVHHLVRLVDDLLDVSRVMRGKIELRPEPIELASVVARAVETAQPLIQIQQHRLDISMSSESLMLDADPVRLAQVIGNLLTNAAKYTEANGQIWLSAWRDGDQAVLKVRDNGIGIAPDMLPHIFDLFVQADHASTKAQGGLGIGLTLVKNLVEMHGGRVEALSAGLGKGCEFLIYLPLMDRRTLPEDNGAAQEIQTVKSTGHRLMVVDDNQDAANTLSMLLRLQGHEVQVTHDGHAALKIATAFKPDMIFLDIGMPGIDGYEVARQVRTMPGLRRQC